MKPWIERSLFALVCLLATTAAGVMVAAQAGEQPTPQLTQVEALAPRS